MINFRHDKYYVTKTIVYYEKPVNTEKGIFDTFEPETIQSINFKNWRATSDWKTCEDCRSRHGKIYNFNETIVPAPPLHNYCRCAILPMESIIAGNATNDKTNGADYYLARFDKLP